MHRSVSARATEASSPPATLAVYQRLAGERQEPAALLGACPLLPEPRIDGFAGAQVDGQSKQHGVPTHPDAAGPEIAPDLVVRTDGVLNDQSRPVGAVAADGDVDPADVAAVLPCGSEVLGRVARQDGSSGVTLQLVAAADGQLAGNRQEPPRNSLGAGDGVPQVRWIGVVGLTDGGDVCLACIDRAVTDAARHGVDLIVDVDLNHVVSLDFCVVVFRVRFRFPAR